MLSLRKTTEAENDLIDIWLYSLDQWGVTQADHYLDQLDKGFSMIVDHPKIGKPVDHIRDGYRALSTGRHIAYYTIDDSTIWIMRILYEGMDPDQHL